MKTDNQILEDLKDRTKGLIWISESDFPFQSVINPNINLNNAIAISDLPSLFSHVTKIKKEMSRGERSIVHQFQRLEKYLIKHLKDVKVYKFKTEDISIFDLYILGKSKSGALIGIKTTIGET